MATDERDILELLKDELARTIRQNSSEKLASGFVPRSKQIEEERTEHATV